MTSRNVKLLCDTESVTIDLGLPARLLGLWKTTSCTTETLEVVDYCRKHSRSSFPGGIVKEGHKGSCTR